MTYYRTTSLLAFFSETQEKDTYSGLNHYLFINTHWSEHFGLRRVIPTENAAFKTKENLCKSINQIVDWRNFLSFGKCFWLCKSWNFVT